MQSNQAFSKFTSGRRCASRTRRSYANGSEQCRDVAGRCGVSDLAVLQYQERCCPATAAQSGSVEQYVGQCPVVWKVRVTELMSVVAIASRAQRIPAARDTVAAGSGFHMSWHARRCQWNRPMFAHGMRSPAVFFTLIGELWTQRQVCCGGNRECSGPSRGTGAKAVLAQRNT